MAIEVDGEKYACEACVRGHRVSNCTHRDRELKHINKKGRPVSQCPHCRGQRKSRQTHVKCICADIAAGITTEQCGQPPCQCQSGQSCTCCMSKREHANTDVNEMARTAAMNASHRRSASNGKPAMAYRKSDSTVPTNARHSFHPPLHRLNNAAHESGMPYPLKRASASHGHLGMSTSSSQRSLEHLPLMYTGGSDQVAQQQQQQQQSQPPPPPTAPQMTSYPPIPQMPSTDMSRSARSSQNSPMVASPSQFDSLSQSQQRFSVGDGSQFSWDANFNANGEFGSSVNNYSAAGSVPPSATDSIAISWSDFDLSNSYNYNAMAQQNPQPPSVDSVDQPSLSRSSSGTASDTAESNTTYDIPFGTAMSHPSMDSLSLQSASWQGGNGFDFEEAFNQQKTPRAPNPDGSVGKFDDYFGNYVGNPNEAGASSAVMASSGNGPAQNYDGQWSNASPGQGSIVSSGLAMNDGAGYPGQVNDADGSEAWNSQLDLSSYADNFESGGSLDSIKTEFNLSSQNDQQYGNGNGNIWG